MEYRKDDDLYVVRLARGEEITSSLLSFSEREGITFATVQGIGAAENIELAFYEVRNREFKTKIFSGEHEIASLAGTISSKDHKPYLHLHAVIGNADFQAAAGHLVAATVSGTCEIVMQARDITIERKLDEEETGLNLWQLSL